MDENTKGVGRHGEAAGRGSGDATPGTAAPAYLETQPERTDLPLAVMPATLDAMAAPMRAQLPQLRDIARVRLHEGFTSDETTLADRLVDADALFVGGYHVSDDLLRRIADPADPRNMGADGTPGAHGGHVRCIVFCGTGVASYVNLDLARELGVRVCNAEHYGDHAVAEHAFALMLELARHVGTLDAQVKAGGWAWANGDGTELFGKRLAIVGLGGIGATVARMARAFGMDVAAWSSHVPDRLFRESGARPVGDLGELLAWADVVSVHLPLIDGATRGIVTSADLDAMRPGTMFVNTARAEVIEPGALLARLRRGDIRAALDVYDHEPLAAGDPLTRIPGIVLTPHVGWRTDGAFAELTRQMAEAMAAFFQGRDVNVVVRESTPWPRG